MKNQWSSILDVDVHQYACKRGAGFRLLLAHVSPSRQAAHACTRAGFIGWRAQRSPFELKTCFIFLNIFRRRRHRKSLPRRNHKVFFQYIFNINIIIIWCWGSRWVLSPRLQVYKSSTQTIRPKGHPLGSMINCSNVTGPSTASSLNRIAMKKGGLIFLPTCTSISIMSDRLNFGLKRRDESLDCLHQLQLLCICNYVCTC